MKILLVTEYFPEKEITGGVEARAYYLSKYLEKDHEVSVICSRQKGQPRETEINGCRVYRVGREHPYSSEGSIISRLLFAEAARKKGEELDFDLVDGQSFLSYLPAHAIAEEAGEKKVATYHETWLGEWIKNKGLITGIGGELWERMALDKEWDRIISVSEFTKDRLVDRGTRPELIEVVPNGVELSEFMEVEAEEYDRPTVCTVSRLTEKKRVDVTMRAFEKVSEEIPEAQLRVVGDGPMFDKLNQLSKKLNADIELLGFIPNKEDVIRVLKDSDLFVSASVLEGFGMSIIEAAASQTPYIVSDIKPHVEVTKGEKGGLIFKRNNVEDLAKKILKILRKGELYEKKREECLVIAKEYDWDMIAGKVEQVYQDLL